MNKELAEKLVARWNSPNGRPLSGSLINTGKSTSEPDCMCAQGWALFESGMTTDEIAKIDQSKADTEVAKRLGISRAHAVLLRNVNDRRADSPSIVLANPSAVLGDQADSVLKFWNHLDSMDQNAWEKIAAAGAAGGAAALAAAGDAARDAAGNAAKDAAWAASWDAAGDAARNAAGNAAWVAARAAAWAAAWATNEIQGASVMRARGIPSFFLPMFGFDSPESVTE